MLLITTHKTRWSLVKGRNSVSSCFISENVAESAVSSSATHTAIVSKVESKCLDVSLAEIVGHGNIWGLYWSVRTEVTACSGPVCIDWSSPDVRNSGFVLHSGWQTWRLINSSETPAASSHALILVLSMLNMTHFFYVLSFILPSCHPFTVLQREFKSWISVYCTSCRCEPPVQFIFSF